MLSWQRMNDALSFCLLYSDQSYMICFECIEIQGSLCRYSVSATCAWVTHRISSLMRSLPRDCASLVTSRSQTILVRAGEMAKQVSLYRALWRGPKLLAPAVGSLQPLATLAPEGSDDPFPCLPVAIHNVNYSFKKKKRFTFNYVCKYGTWAANSPWGGQAAWVISLLGILSCTGRQQVPLKGQKSMTHYSNLDHFHEQEFRRETKAPVVSLAALLFVFFDSAYLQIR